MIELTPTYDLSRSPARRGAAREDGAVAAGGATQRRAATCARRAPGCGVLVLSAGRPGLGGDGGLGLDRQPAAVAAVGTTGAVFRRLWGAGRRRPASAGRRGSCAGTSPLARVEPRARARPQARLQVRKIVSPRRRIGSSHALHTSSTALRRGGRPRRARRLNQRSPSRARRGRPCAPHSPARTAKLSRPIHHRAMPDPPLHL